MYIVAYVCMYTYIRVCNIIGDIYFDVFFIKHGYEIAEIGVPDVAESDADEDYAGFRFKE